MANASEALAGHLALMKTDGDVLPTPRSVGAVKADPQLADDIEGALVKIVVPAASPALASH